MRENAEEEQGGVGEDVTETVPVPTDREQGEEEAGQEQGGEGEGCSSEKTYIETKHHGHHQTLPHQTPQRD